MEKDKILKTYFQNYVNAESELRLFVSRFCLCCFSFQAFWGNVPQGGNPEFKVSYLFPPSNSSNTIKQDFVLLCLLLQNLTILFVNLCKGSKGLTPLQTYFVSKMYTISVKTRLLKIHKKKPWNFKQKSRSIALWLGES